LNQLEALLQQCTVKITVPGGWGTGFFVAPELILTCAHVVRKAADSQVTVSYPAWQQPLAAIVKATADDRKTLDLALVELAEPLPDHPCVLLGEEPVAIGQALYSYGYLESYTNAAPVRPVNEGWTGDTPPLLKLQGAQIERGISGAALLNLKTGKVCGMVKETRAAGFDLGGGAIPTRVILDQFPELRELQRQFHRGDRRWVNLITQSGTDFQPYLRSLTATYEKWWQYYTLTDAEGKQRQKQESAPIFDFGLMVQTMPKQEREQEQEGKEKIERFSVLDGLRKYALGEKPEPVLLVGRPGSGKSTALARLMLEAATDLLTDEADGRSLSVSSASQSAALPILVELRYWQGSIAQLILDAFNRHGCSVTTAQLETVLARSLILFDGVNELPSEAARSQLMDFRRNHPKVPMIFTTRNLSLGGDLGIERKLEMQPLTEMQMQAFIRAYIPAQAEDMLRQLKERLREFGQTPLLLWMLCEVFQQAPNNQLPSNLGGVFQAFTQMYKASSVRKHEVALLKGDVRPLSDRRLWKKALMAIAAIMMQGKTPVDFRVAIHRDEVEREISRVFPNEPFPVRDILDDLLKYHLLQNRSADQIEFRHQLLQEYYAAESLLRQLPNLTDTQLKQDYLNYLKWTEPLALMLALVESEMQTLQIVRVALAVDWMLGARLAGESKQEFQEKTLHLLNKLELPEPLMLQLYAKMGTLTPMLRLIEYLKEEDVQRRKSAVHALALINSKDAVRAMLIALEDTYADVRYSAEEALRKTRSEYTMYAIGELRKALNHPQPFVRRSAERVLAALVHPLEYSADEDYSTMYVYTLAPALEPEEEEEEVRSSTENPLCESGSDIPGLLQLIEDSNSDVRWRAAEALGKIDPEKAIPGLLQLIEDSNSYVRWRAAEALGKIGSEKAVPGLLQLIEDSDLYVRWRAAEALGKIDPEKAIPGLLQLIEDSNSYVRRNAAEALGKIGSEKAVPGLLQLIEDSDLYVRWRVAEALGKIGSEKVLPGLLQLIEDSNSDVRWRAAEALGKIGSEKVVSGLLQLIEDGDSYVRWIAVEALDKIVPETMIPGLLMLAEDVNPDVRRRAAEALGRIGSEKAVPSLLQLVEDTNSDVRKRAAGALCKTAKKHPNELASHLPRLLSLILTHSGQDVYRVIFAIQANCKYYNYEVYQAHLTAQNRDRPNHQNRDRPATINQFPNVTEVKIFEQVDHYHESPKDPPP
jgi:HEAT repeat protein